MVKLFNNTVKIAEDSAQSQKCSSGRGMAFDSLRKFINWENMAEESLFYGWRMALSSAFDRRFGLKLEKGSFVPIEPISAYNETQFDELTMPHIKE